MFRDSIMLQSAGKMIAIKVKSDNSIPDMFTLNLEYFETIKDMKEKIYTLRRAPPCRQQLFLGENELKEYQTLTECGLQNGSCINLKGKEDYTD